jgi:hypothetical protein
MEKLIAVNKSVFVRCPQTHNQWKSVSLWNCEKVVPERQGGMVKTTRLNSFEDLYNFCQEGELRNGEACLSLFRKKPYVRISDNWELHLNLTPKNFKWLEVKVEYIPCPHWSMDYLRRELPAADFARLCQSQGWLMCGNA